MIKRLAAVFVGDAVIAAIVLALVLTRRAPLVPVGITAMVCGMSFNYFVLRKATGETPQAATNPESSGGSTKAGLERLAGRLAGVSGLILVVGTLISIFADHGKDLIFDVLLMLMGGYFIRIGLD